MPTKVSLPLESACDFRRKYVLLDSHLLPSHLFRFHISDQPYYSHYASALFSLIVFIGTTQFAFFLRKMKFSPFGPNQMIRNSVTDFAVVISILIWSLIGNSLDNVPIEKLNVPSVFAPTFQCCEFSNQRNIFVSDEVLIYIYHLICPVSYFGLVGDASCTTSWPNDCYGQEEPYGYRSWIVNLGKHCIYGIIHFPFENLTDRVSCR